MAHMLRLAIINRYEPDGWKCTDFPPGPGETPVGGGVFIKQRCEKAMPEKTLTVETRFLRKPGQAGEFQHGRSDLRPVRELDPLRDHGPDLPQVVTVGAIRSRDLPFAIELWRVGFHWMVIAGLVPATPIRRHGRATYRGRRDKPGDDEGWVRPINSKLSIQVHAMKTTLHRRRFRHRGLGLRVAGARDLLVLQHPDEDAVGDGARQVRLSRELHHRRERRRGEQRRHRRDRRRGDRAHQAQGLLTAPRDSRSDHDGFAAGPRNAGRGRRHVRRRRIGRGRLRRARRTKSDA